MDLTTTTLAVLAGGRGARMGTPKAWLRLADQPILAWQLDRLQWPGPTMLVTSPGAAPPPGVERFDQCVTDKVEGLGPLAGLLAMLEHLTTPYAVAITVDMPAVTREQIAWLAETLVSHPECSGLLCAVQAPQETLIEPFPSVYRPAAAPAIARRVAAGQLAIRDLRNEPGFLAVQPPAAWPRATWSNLNRPEDMAAFQATQNTSHTEKPS